MKAKPQKPSKQTPFRLSTPLEIDMRESIARSMRFERLVSGFQVGVFQQQIERVLSYKYDYREMQRFVVAVRDQLGAFLMPDLFGYDLFSDPNSDYFKGILHEHQIKKLKELIQREVQLAKKKPFPGELSALDLKTKSLPDNIADIVTAHPLEALPGFLYEFNRISREYDIQIHYGLPEGYKPKKVLIKDRKTEAETVRKSILLGMEKKTATEKTTSRKKPQTETVSNEVQAGSIATRKKTKSNNTDNSAVAFVPIDLQCTVAEAAILFKTLKVFMLIDGTDKDFAQWFTIKGKPITNRMLRQAKADMIRGKNVASAKAKQFVAELISDFIDAMELCNENHLKDVQDSIRYALQKAKK